MKKADEEKVKKASEGVNLDFEPSEFDEFETLTRKLMAVPKAELDAKRKESDATS